MRNNNHYNAEKINYKCTSENIGKEAILQKQRNKWSFSTIFISLCIALIVTASLFKFGKIDSQVYSICLAWLSGDFMNEYMKKKKVIYIILSILIAIASIMEIIDYFIF